MKQLLTLLSFSIIIACSAPSEKKENTMTTNDFDKQGHRGCRGLMPENTIPAFKKAIDLGVNTLEMDVVITKDNQVILSHEPFFNHEITTKPDGKHVEENEEKSLNIYQMTYEETQKYDVGLKPHPRFTKQEKLAAHKPKLADVIDSAEAYAQRMGLAAMQYNIETKTMPERDSIYHPKPAEFVELLIAVIKEKKIEDRVIIQSFDIRTLQYLHNKYPNIKTAYLFEPPSDKSLTERLALLGFKPTIYSPAYETLTAEVIKECKDAGIKVIPWTVNEVSAMNELKKMGVDGIISDYPDLFKDLN
ncbi:MAG: glycerophosphodiester phosphodiesterase [Bacteroidia bacterium]